MRRLLAKILSLIGLAGAGMGSPVAADPRVLSRLTDEQRPYYLAWKEARASYDRIHDAYWAAVDARRIERRRKYAAGVRYSPADYIMQQPPKYHGPALRPDIAKVMADLAPSSSPPSEIATLPEMLTAARQIYRFAPTIIPEREFKRRYAAEALALGLTRDEVVRIYAFETGGRGTFDMQAGINPETKQGRAISTALGYAQLLAANSIDEVTRTGDGFVSRLGMIAARRDTPPERAREIMAKIEALRAMMRTARSVPREWSQHTELARTPPGYAIHVLNLDGDVGPWLQVIKLRGVKDTAEKAGRPGLAPAELEMMNLAGPRTGLEMMEPPGQVAPTANFFSKAAYYRNTIVREKTAAELLAAIDERMGEAIKRPGSIEFAAAFDEVGNGPRPISNDQRQQLLPVVPARPMPVAVLPPPAQRPVPPGPVPPIPVQAARQPQPQPPIDVPMPVRAERPERPVQPQPAPRFQWAPADLGERTGLPAGFPQ